MKDRLKNDIGLKIMAVLFATILWLFVVNEENPITTVRYSVPIEITHPEVVTTTGKLSGSGRYQKRSCYSEGNT